MIQFVYRQTKMLMELHKNRYTHTHTFLLYAYIFSHCMGVCDPVIMCVCQNTFTEPSFVMEKTDESGMDTLHYIPQVERII